MISSRKGLASLSKDCVFKSLKEVAKVTNKIESQNCFKSDKYGIEGCHIMNVKDKTMEQCQESIIDLILQDQGDNRDYKKDTEFSNFSNITTKNHPQGKNFSMKCHKNSFRYIFSHFLLKVM